MKMLGESAPIRISSIALRMFLQHAAIVGIRDRLG
jgi:hypothetical protein